MSPRTVRRLVIGVFVIGIGGMIAGSIADNNGFAITFGLITAAAAVGLILVTAVTAPGAFGPRPAAGRRAGRPPSPPRWTRTPRRGSRSRLVNWCRPAPTRSRCESWCVAPSASAGAVDDLAGAVDDLAGAVDDLAGAVDDLAGAVDDSRYCVGPMIMPAATVRLVRSSMRMKLPVSRLRA